MQTQCLLERPAPCWRLSEVELMQRCWDGSRRSRLGGGGEDGAGGRHAPPERRDRWRRQAGALADVQVSQPARSAAILSSVSSCSSTLPSSFQPPQACRGHRTSSQVCDCLHEGGTRDHS